MRRTTGKKAARRKLILFRQKSLETMFYTVLGLQEFQIMKTTRHLFMKTNYQNPMVKKATLIMLALTSLALFQGCNNNSGTTEEAPRKKLHLAFIANTPDD